MEHALYLRDSEDLNLFDSSKFQRIYFGNEFCENLLPPKEELTKILDFVKNKNLLFTFVLPYLTNENINHLLHILPPQTEVVFNNWNLLDLINKHNLSPVMGRLLLEANRNLELGQDTSSLSKESNINQLSLQNFLIENNVKRVELDNLPQGYDLELKKDISSSFHYPFVYVSYVHCSGKKDNSGCNFQCLKKQFIKRTNKNIILCGNTKFYFNNTKPAINKAWNVNRLVYTPWLPFSLSQKENWDLYFKKHPSFAHWGTDTPDDHVVKFIQNYSFPRGTKILDVGCGHGKNSKYLINQNYNVWGIDISGFAIKYCKRSNMGGQFCVQDAREMKFEDSSFDVICDAGCLYVNKFQNHNKILREYFRVLKSGGKAFIRIFRNDRRDYREVPLFYVENLPIYGYPKQEAKKIILQNNFIIQKQTQENYYGMPMYFFYLKKP